MPEMMKPLLNDQQQITNAQLYMFLANIYGNLPAAINTKLRSNLVNLSLSFPSFPSSPSYYTGGTIKKGVTPLIRYMIYYA